MHPCIYWHTVVEIRKIGATGENKISRSELNELAQRAKELALASSQTAGGFVGAL